MNRVALISGSSRGIGRAIAEKLASKSYLVYVNGRTKETVERTVDEIRKSGGQASPLVADFSDEKTIQESIEPIVKEHAKIDTLVCNLGSGSRDPNASSQQNELRRVFEINFFSATQLTYSLLPYLREGSVVFVSSIAGTEAIGAPTPYQSAKAALNLFAKSLADQFSETGVRANSVSPGNVLFEGGTWDQKVKADPKKIEEYIRSEVPLGRFLKPEEIAEGVFSLIENPAINGTNLVIDGGQTRKV